MPCTASQLIERLYQMIAEHGDVPVLVRDTDTEWLLPVGLVGISTPDEDWPSKRIEIRSSYHRLPDGYIASRGE